jgi:hypothetical protein
MMADKKVDRYRPERALDPTQQSRSDSSNAGAVGMADTTYDKGKLALFDKFRRREERWRREQSVHAREAADMAVLLRRKGSSTPAGSTDDPGTGEGGAK